MYLDNFGEEPSGDIREIDERDVPDHDILTACIPSPSLSSTGRKPPKPQGNLSLFGDVIRIIDAKKPAAFFLQGMVGLLRPLRIHQNIMDVLNDKLSYYSLHKHIIDARCMVPQRNRRSYIVGFKEKTQFTFPRLEDQHPKLRDILESDVDPRYTISDKLWKRVKENIQKQGEDRRFNNLTGKRFEILDLDGMLRRSITLKTVWEAFIPQGEGKNPRRFTPRECARLMGFPDSFRIPFSDAKAYGFLCNSVIVPVVERIAKTMVDCLVLQVWE